jgi:hypothetical protein
VPRRLWPWRIQTALARLATWVIGGLRTFERMCPLKNVIASYFPDLYNARQMKSADPGLVRPGAGSLSFACETAAISGLFLSKAGNQIRRIDVILI